MDARRANPPKLAPQMRRAGIVFAAGLAALGGAGCAVGPDFARPAPPVADRFTREPLAPQTVAAGGVSQRFDASASLPADWWRLFQSPGLDATVRRALANSPTLQAAQASLRQSQDKLRAGASVFWPRLDAGLAAARARNAPVEQGSSLPGTVYNVVTASGSISYPLDLFGGERRAVEGLRAQVDAQGHAERAAALTLSANVR